MIIEPVVRGTLCATAHPDGCARRVADDIADVRSRSAFDGPRRVLVVGSSAGLGLASRIALGFGAGSATVGVCLERPGTPTRAGTAGWYNTAALEAELAAAGRYGRTVVGDAFSEETKQRTAELVRSDLGAVDLVVHSLAAPRRALPGGGHHSSALRAVGTPFTDKSYDGRTGQVVRRTLPVASLREIRETVSVMGGDDWSRWIEVLTDADALDPAAATVAFSYMGNVWLAPSYRTGTIGRAKEHLEWTARAIDATRRPFGGSAHAAVMRALVTQASSVIDSQTLYAILLLKVLEEKGLGESTLEQAHRLFAERMYGPGPLGVDAEGRIRMDDRELSADVQTEVHRRWHAVDSDNLAELGAPDRYRAMTMALYGFGVPGVDESRPTDPVRDVPGVVVLGAAR